MATILDFVPPFHEDANTIRARLDSDANAGLDPASPSFLDTTPGGWWYDVTQPFVLEIERLYDTMGTDYIAGLLPLYAWGAMLDEDANTVGITRNDAVSATGEVTFAGTDGTPIAVGTQVAVQQVDPNADPVAFVTTESGIISSGSLILAVEAIDPGAVGNVAAGQIVVLLTQVSGVATVTNVAATTGGADVETDDELRLRVLLEWQMARGGGTIGDYESWSLDYDGVGNVRVVPNMYGVGTVGIIITDPENQPSSGTVVTGLQDELDPPNATTTLASNATLPTGTLSLTSTAGFDGIGRIILVHGGVAQVLSYTGVSGNDITGVTGGSGAVTAGDAVYQCGRGDGKAPVGAVVVVTTPAQETIAVAATVHYDTGYSKDGSGGTVAIGQAITDAITSYISQLAPGEDVVRLQAMAQGLLVPGVLDFTAFTLDGGGGPVSTNIAVDDQHVATPGAVVLT